MSLNGAYSDIVNLEMFVKRRVYAPRVHDVILGRG